MTYDLRGTCGVVRVSADGATVTMPAAPRLVLEGAGNTVTAEPVYDAEVTGSDNSLALTRADRVVLTGDRSPVTVARERTTLRDRSTAKLLDHRPRRQ